MSLAFEELMEFDQVGGTADVLVAGSPEDGIQISVTDPDGQVVCFSVSAMEGMRLQRAIRKAGAAACQSRGGAA